MRAVVIGGGMAGLFSALALREAGVFDRIDVYEQASRPTTAGAGLAIAPNGARLCHWLGIDLDGGDPKGASGVIDGGRAAILKASRNIMPDLSVTVKPFAHNTPEQIAAGGGFHHMHRQDLLMCLLKRVQELGPNSGVRCPIHVAFGKRLVGVTQDTTSASASFEDGTTAKGDVLIGADGINSNVLKQVWPNTPKRRWTGSVIFRGVIPRDKVAALRKRDGSQLDFNAIEGPYQDAFLRDSSLCMRYWVRGGELLAVNIMWYEPDSQEFTEDWADWRPVENAELVATLDTAWAGDPRKEDMIAMGRALESPTKWGLYDRDAFEQWVDNRVCLIGDAAHPMLPTFGQGASQSFEDGAALSNCFRLHSSNVPTALVHYERVRHYRATRLQFSSKMAFKNLQPKDSLERQKMLETVNERDFPTFFHEDRGGSDDSWIYEYDARNVGSELPSRRLGPWDFRKGEAAEAARAELAASLWRPAELPVSDREITREELERHNTFDDCWVVVHGKVYDFSKWKDHHPGGAFVAKLYAGKDATAEFGEFHSKHAVEHMKYFRVGDFVG